MLKGEIIRNKVKNIAMVLLFVVTIILVGFFFTSIRTNAISSESFEASPVAVYDIESLDELTAE